MRACARARARDTRARADNRNVKNEQEWLSQEGIDHRARMGRLIHRALADEKEFERAPARQKQSENHGCQLMLPTAEGFVLQHSKFGVKLRGWAWLRARINKTFFRTDKSIYFTETELPAGVNLRADTITSKLRCGHRFSSRDIARLAQKLGETVLQLHSSRLALCSLDPDVVAIFTDVRGEQTPLILDYSSAVYVDEDVARTCTLHRAVSLLHLCGSKAE